MGLVCIMGWPVRMEPLLWSYGRGGAGVRGAGHDAAAAAGPLPVRDGDAVLRQPRLGVVRPLAGRLGALVLDVLAGVSSGHEAGGPGRGGGLVVLAEHGREVGLLLHHDVVSSLGLGVPAVCRGRLLALALGLRLGRRPADARVAELLDVAVAGYRAGGAARPRGG